jgi:hypothetical protein
MHQLDRIKMSLIDKLAINEAVRSQKMKISMDTLRGWRPKNVVNAFVKTMGVAVTFKVSKHMESHQ